MNIKKIKNEPEVFWEIKGYIDSDNYHLIENELQNLNYDNLSITLDMSNVSYITSAFIRVLLVCRKKLPKEKIVLRDANECIKEIFVSSGFDDMITFEKTTEKSILKKGYTELLRDRVKENPKKIAYLFDDESYTWEDIEKQSQIIASDLEKLHIGKGSRVGIFSKNSISWISTFFAIQKLGAIAIFLDFNLNEERLKMLIEIGDIEYICYGEITNISDIKDFYKSESKHLKNIYCINNSDDLKNRYVEYESIKNKYENVGHADDPSMIVFTSGSTGKPKAVISSSYNRIIACINDMKIAKFTENDVACVYLPLFHLFAFTTAVSLELLSNATISIISNVSKETILNTIEKNHCTYLPTVPTFLSSISINPIIDKYNVESVTSVILGGEPITVEQINNIKSKFKNAHIIVGYGLSEIVPISKSLYNDVTENITGTVGKILDGIKIKIVDIITNKECKNGEVGEIRAYSDFAMTGYYKLDIDSQPLDDEGYIKTGDLGYKRDDGYLVYTGRIKELIIKNGENISPNFIASIINSYEDIAASKVFGIPDKRCGEEVAVAIVLRDGCNYDEDKFKEYLSMKLAKNMIPKYIKVYTEFPLLSNKKIDTVKLKEEMINSKES